LRSRGCFVGVGGWPLFFIASVFTTTVWRDWLTAEVLAGYNLNERQMKAVGIIKAQGRITNREYREQAGVIIRTASRDLEELVDKGLLEKIGTTGRNTFYVLARKLDIK